MPSLRGRPKIQDRPVEAVERELREVSPMNEFTQPEDVADAILFLCSDRAVHITGEDLNVSAGVVMSRPAGRAVSSSPTR
jgi:NAD(P)-dependent dehydrogenase (short-subunit alcohol dehydrogenase family)